MNNDVTLSIFQLLGFELPPSDNQLAATANDAVGETGSNTGAPASENDISFKASLKRESYSFQSCVSRHDKGSMMILRGNANLTRFALVAFVAFGAHAFAPTASTKPSATALNMKRPILDQIATALFKLENSRVEASSEMDEQGRMGEPMEWSESSSAANRFSEVVASNPIGYQFKQWVADIVAGDYDEQAVEEMVDSFVQDNDVAMFSFTTCPFCRRAKDVLDEKGISYKVLELDELEGNDGNEIRAVVGKRTKRTSVPSIFIGGKYIGGCNDGPGLIPLAESGELDNMIEAL